jgi:hypothetical protein
MTPETAWAEAMKFENRANPYRFFDELRKTPGAHVGDGVYAVTGYRELGAPNVERQVYAGARGVRRRVCQPARFRGRGRTRGNALGLEHCRRVPASTAGWGADATRFHRSGDLPKRKPPAWPGYMGSVPRAVD